MPRGKRVKALVVTIGIDLCSNFEQGTKDLLKLKETWAT